MKQTLLECVRSAGAILLQHFGQAQQVKLKGDQSSVVTAADLASERWIVSHIRARFPQHGIVAEESGWMGRSSEFTWVVDPLDGTSNFAVGLPWFGVQIAVLCETVPVLAAMYLPCTGTLYFSEKGQGVYRDEMRVRVTAEADLCNVLCACGLDASADESRTRRQVELLHRVANGVRNVRATNCLLDFCYTIDGRLGACVNLNTKIWDIAPACLMFPEAGGRFTNLTGQEITFQLDAETFDRSYAVCGASQGLHPELLRLLKQATV